MERGSDKKGPQLDEEMKKETAPLERSTRESHVEDFREMEGATEGAPGSEEQAGSPSGQGHRAGGTGSSADSLSYADRGEEGGASHPKPKDSDERSDRLP